jgi:hypothetical protein
MKTDLETTKLTDEEIEKVQECFELALYKSLHEKYKKFIYWNDCFIGCVFGIFLMIIIIGFLT